MLIKMVVRNLTLDPMTNLPILILRDESGDLVVPIWIGIFEANAIVLELEQMPTIRPLTHDLTKTIIEKLGATISRIMITDLDEGTYFAVIELKTDHGKITIDSRPSDAIALALRFRAPIYVNQDVIAKGNASDHDIEKDSEKLKNWLKSLKPEDFGDYSM